MEHWVRTVLQTLQKSEGATPPNLTESLERIADLIETDQNYQYRRPELQDHAEMICDSEDLDELSSIVDKAARLCGFSSFAIFVIKVGLGNSFSNRICTSYHEGWINRYRQKDYQYIDPVISQAMVSDDPFAYSDISSSSPVVKDFWSDAEAHGIGSNGLCVAQNGPRGCRLAISFGSTLSQEETQRMIQQDGRDLVALGEEAMHQFLSFFSISPQGKKLEEKELLYLYRLATGEKPTTACQKSQHLEAAICKKANVRSIGQAIHLAGVEGWFDDLPYQIEDVVRPACALCGPRS